MQERYSRQSHHQEKPPRKDDCKCKENDTATQKLINTERKSYCDYLDTVASDVYKWEENYKGLHGLKKKRRCLFIWTEYNYQAFRNLQVGTGTSLKQFNESIKDSTAVFLKSNKALSDILKDIVKKIKDLKAKIYGLRDAACDLKHCTDEGCNATQWGILTGDWSKCKGETKEPPKRPPECDNLKEKFEKLFCIPKSLAADVDSLYKASADVVGIQVFSNIGTLENLQKTLSLNADALDNHLKETVKKDQEDVKKVQDEYTLTVKEYTKSKAILYGKRSEFDAAFETAAFFCCPKCGCITDKICEERLHDCKDKICEICEEVKETFCECQPESSSAS